MYNNKLTLFQRSSDSIWTDPYISKNLLAAHLDEQTDGASRNRKIREKTVNWIADQLQSDSRILDLGCGPGLYALEFAKLGYKVTGIDFNRESIKYANKNSRLNNLVTYRYQNYLQDPIVGKYSAAVMIYCDFGALVPQEQKLLLEKIWSVLSDDGIFIFDVFTSRLVEHKAEMQSQNVSDGKGFWSETPYSEFTEVKHFKDANAIGSRHCIVGLEDGEAKEYIMWDQYYGENSIRSLLLENGFVLELINDNLIKGVNFISDEVMFVAARKCRDSNM